MHVKLVEKPVSVKKAYYALMVRSANNRIAKQQYVIVQITDIPANANLASIYLEFNRHPDKPKGYTTDATKFGLATVVPVAEHQCAALYIGMTEVARIYDRPTIGSTAVDLAIKTLYITPAPNMALRPNAIEQLAALGTLVAPGAVWRF